MPQAATPAGFAIWRKQLPNATACFGVFLAAALPPRPPLGRSMRAARRILRQKLGFACGLRHL
jgi:hypothetical protein